MPCQSRSTIEVSQPLHTQTLPFCCLHALNFIFLITWSKECTWSGLDQEMPQVWSSRRDHPDLSGCICKYIVPVLFRGGAQSKRHEELVLDLVIEGSMEQMLQDYLMWEQYVLVPPHNHWLNWTHTIHWFLLSYNTQPVSLWCCARDWVQM